MILVVAMCYSSWSAAWMAAAAPHSAASSTGRSRFVRRCQCTKTGCNTCLWQSWDGPL